MKQIIQSIVKHILPESILLPLKFTYYKLCGKLDKEMMGVGEFLSKRRRFIDIGANTGYYSYHFSRTFQFGEAFEPFFEASKMLQALQNHHLTIHNIALSNQNGTQKFYIPLENGRPEPGLASLEPRDGDCEIRNVPIKMLDDFGFDDVDLIKIDVEGHELKVLQGALATIKKCKPVMIVEVEQRHIDFPIQEVFNFMIDAGYDGMFLQDSVWQSIDLFSNDVHQAPYLNNVYDSRYINNFVFYPHSKSQQSTL
jgi:FkbM family methyltransferase